MRILILGGTGLIGAALSKALQVNGHDVRTLSRSRAPNTIYGDFAQLQSIAAWLPLLDGVDVVVNAVGIFNERPSQSSQSFTDLHVNAPIALFAACDNTALPERDWRFERIWTLLGFPAFISLMVVYWLMVNKPF